MGLYGKSDSSLLSRYEARVPGNPIPEAQKIERQERQEVWSRYGKGLNAKKHRARVGQINVPAVDWLQEPLYLRQEQYVPPELKHV